MLPTLVAKGGCNEAWPDFLHQSQPIKNEHIGHFPSYPQSEPCLTGLRLYVGQTSLAVFVYDGIHLL